MEERLIYLGGSSTGKQDGPGPSSTALQIGGRGVVLVDCGIQILQKGRYGFPYFDALISRGLKVSAAVLTHAHLDHIGSLGVASERGIFESGAKILGTPQTNAWLPSVLDETWGRGVGGDYYAAVNRVIARLRIIPYGEFEILPGIPVFAGVAGHVPGALYFLVRLPSGKVVLFCGDNSWHDQEMVGGSLLPDDLPDCWLPDIIAVTDLTNPSLTKFDYGLEMGRLVKYVGESLSKNRIVVLPAFAYGREQNIALALAKAGIKPVYADGSGVDAFSVFGDNRWSPRDREFSLEGIEMIGADGVKKGRQREDLLANGGPLVIVSPAGFGDGGPIRYYLERGIKNPNFEFIATSWLLPGCTMDQLLEKVRRRTETGKKIYMKLENEQSEVETKYEVNCHTNHFRPSAHGGLGDNAEMAKKIVARRGKEIETIVLTHGSQESKQKAAGVLSQFTNSVIFGLPGTVLNIT